MNVERKSPREQGQGWGDDAESTARALAAAALDDYGGAGGRARLDLINLSENATFRVEWSDRRAPTILRLHRAHYNSPAEIESELAWAESLRSDGVLTPTVIPTTSGQRRGQLTAASGGERHSYVMFEQLPGSEMSTIDMAGSLERLGTINAKMHQHAKGWAPPAGFTRRTWDLDTMLGGNGHWGPWQNGAKMTSTERHLLERAVDLLTVELTLYGKGADRFGLTHADLRPANVLIDGEDTYVIDFDDCGFTWYLYDAATAMTHSEGHEQAPTYLQAWVRGYERVTPLSRADRGVMPSMLMLRRLMSLAWRGSHAHTRLAAELSKTGLDGTCTIAERYLRRDLDWL